MTFVLLMLHSDNINLYFHSNMQLSLWVHVQMSNGSNPTCQNSFTVYNCKYVTVSCFCYYITLSVDSVYIAFVGYILKVSHHWNVLNY
jgi:hypothetical protein